jgi:hypothetical protein
LTTAYRKPKSRSEGVRIRPAGLPALTLYPQIKAWSDRYIIQPDGPDAGKPFKLTEEQEHFALWWFATDSRGRFVYRRGMLRRMKGWGKDPFGAWLCIVEFVGPCRFSHFDRTGWPIAKQHPAAWVQIAAVSRDQTRNTMTLFPGMISKRAISTYKIDMGKEIIYAEGGKKRIEAVTSSPRSLEGQRSTFVLKNETHLWFGANEGHAMAEVIARNLAKSRGGDARSLAISNAHAPGEDSDAERDWDAYEKMIRGETRSTGFLYDSLEAPPETDLYEPESLTEGLLAARGDSDWLDVERLLEEIYDPKTAPSTARRFYLNQIAAEEDSWLSRQEWDACAVPRVVQPGEMITLGFDGSKSNDHTCLTGCALSDSHIFSLGVWDPKKYKGEIPRKEVDAAVEKAFTDYDVVGFLADVEEWESYIDIWEEDFGEELCVKSNSHHAIAFDMRQRKRESTMAIESLYDAVLERQVTHDGDPKISQYVYNAKRRPNNFGISIGKENQQSDKKIDFAITAALARKARQDYLALPESKKRRKAGISVYVEGDDYDSD